MRKGDESVHRHTLAPIGDELEFQSHPLEIGSPSRLDFVRRKVAALLPRPTTRLGQVGHGLVFFLLSVTIVAACAYGIGQLVDHNSGLTHNRSLVLVFILLGAVAKYGMWQRHPAFWTALGIAIVAIGFAVWGRSTH
jgi:hypothetical protein